MRKPSSTKEEIPGTGACPEAQADGVPCVGTDGNCPDCDRAVSDEGKTVKKDSRRPPPSQASISRKGA